MTTTEELVLPPELIRAQELSPIFFLSPAVHHCMGLIDSYRAASIQQHPRIFYAWGNKDYKQALCELHFYLIAINRVLYAWRMSATSIENEELKTFVANANSLLENYKDARDHFEHSEDRMHGSGRNAPEPIIGENGNPRTIGFGLEGPEEEAVFKFGKKSISINSEFLSVFIGLCNEFEEMIFKIANDSKKTMGKSE